MDIVSNKKEKIFKRTFEDRTLYSIGMSKKDKDGNYINGYTDVVFNKGVEVEDKSYIIIKKAWLDFYTTKNEKGKTITHTFVRVSEFEVADDKKEQPKEEQKQDGWGNPKDIQIEPDELPFY